MTRVSYGCKTERVVIRFLFVHIIHGRGSAMLPGYDVRKAAQVVAFFALKDGGSINVLKLSKLLYLVEREFMARHDAPMFYDKLVSMPDGPVASVTLNLINGNAEHDRWSEIVAKREGYDIRPAQGMTFEALDELSRADLDVLNDLWARFGKFDKYFLRDWTHKPENIPEWVDPEGSSLPIHHADVFKHLKKERVDVLIEDIEERRALARSLNANS